MNEADPQDVGDEPLLLKRSTHAPIFVAKKRIQAARALLAAYPHTQLILSDDGLQHLSLHYKETICLFDTRGVGNGFLLPAGPLREFRNFSTWTLSTDASVRIPTYNLKGSYVIERRLADYAIRSDGSCVALRALQGDQALPLYALAAIARSTSFF